MISLKFGTAILVSHRSAPMLMERMTLTPLEVAQAVSLLGQVRSSFSICIIVLLLLSPHHPPSFQLHPPPSTQHSILHSHRPAFEANLKAHSTPNQLPIVRPNLQSNIFTLEVSLILAHFIPISFPHFPFTPTFLFPPLHPHMQSHFQPNIFTFTTPKLLSHYRPDFSTLEQSQRFSIERSHIYTISQPHEPHVWPHY